MSQSEMIYSVIIIPLVRKLELMPVLVYAKI